MHLSYDQTEERMISIYNRHVNTIYQVCFMYMKNQTDTEDAVQTTFLKLMKCQKEFESIEHEKAWLIVTASNICKNELKHWWRRNGQIEEELLQDKPKKDTTKTLLLNLPDKYKLAIYLYYYMGYSTSEIAQKLNKKEATVRSLLSRGRNLLKIMIEENEHE